MVKKNIGVEAKRPVKECNDSKCPWHGTLSLRGRIITGIVVSDKAAKTVVIKWDYAHYLKKYQVFERRHSTVTAYSPECIGAKKGDTVRVMECRPISKTKAFAVIEVLK